MRVKAITSFVAVHDKQTYSVQEGMELEMPEGADWLRAKFVVPVIAAIAPETAAVGASEAAVMPKAKRK